MQIIKSDVSACKMHCQLLKNPTKNPTNNYWQYCLNSHLVCHLLWVIDHSCTTLSKWHLFCPVSLCKFSDINFSFPLDPSIVSIQKYALCFLCEWCENLMVLLCLSFIDFQILSLFPHRLMSAFLWSELKFHYYSEWKCYRYPLCHYLWAPETNLVVVLHFSNDATQF